MSNWEQGIIPLAANFQNNTEEPLDAREVVQNLDGLNEIQSPYAGLVVYVRNGGYSYLCQSVNNIGTSYSGGVVNPANWKQIHHEVTTIDGGQF
tara:strand:+ start:194 stop:475 length:282 start_codon:yes stop_codon:yes gene_type:complete